MYFSPGQNKFYPGALRRRYEAAGDWPSDAMAVPESLYVTYSNAPPGKRRVVIDGLPAWDDVPPLSIEAQREVCAELIRAAFKNAITQPVDAAALQWNGGMESALAIDGAVRLVELAGGTAVELFDSNNDGHIVSIATGQQIAAAIAADFQVKFAHKQQLLRDITTADETQLQTVVWSI